MVTSWPSPCQLAPFQPSPYESYKYSVHHAPGTTSRQSEAGAPPDKLLPSLQESDQLHSEA